MKIKCIHGDITKVSVDIIVNAANTSLLGGGGVDGAIHRSGGKIILEACIKIRNKQGGCKIGEAVITSGGLLPAKYVIHTVGSVWNGGGNNEEELLRNCYINSLKLAKTNNAKSIAFPNISKGIYKFPKEKAARIAIDAIKENPMINEVVFVCYDSEIIEFIKAY